MRQAYIRAPRRGQYPSTAGGFDGYMCRFNDLRLWRELGRRTLAGGQTLDGAGFGEFHGDPQLDFAHDRVEPGVAGLLGQALATRPSAGRAFRRRRVPSSKPSLSASSTSSALRPLTTARFLRSLEVLDALQRHQRVERGDRAQARRRPPAWRGILRLAEREAAAGGAARARPAQSPARLRSIRKCASLKSPTGDRSPATARLNFYG